jgi:hypothetical protein
LDPIFFQLKASLRISFLIGSKLIAQSGRKLTFAHAGQESMQFALHGEGAAVNGARKCRLDAELVSEKWLLVR